MYMYQIWSHIHTYILLRVNRGKQYYVTLFITFPKMIYLFFTVKEKHYYQNIYIHVLCKKHAFRLFRYTVSFLTCYLFTDGPRAMTLSPNATTYTLNSGATLGSINCSADCNPPCTFAWTKGGNTISNTQTLIHTIRDKSDAGTYTCKATRRLSFSETRNITVNVICEICSVKHLSCSVRKVPSDIYTV